MLVLFFVRLSNKPWPLTFSAAQFLKKMRDILMTMKSLNPATGEEIKTYETHGDAEIEQALQTAHARFSDYRLVGFEKKSGWMNQAASILENEKEKWAGLLTEEMGKTIKAAIAEVEKCAWVCRYYADNAEEIMKDRVIESSASRSYVRHLPIGPVLAVMPWNFPFWQVFRFAAPALMAGNVGLLKHASNVPGASLAIEEIFLKAGFPEGCFQSLLIGSGKVEQILKDDRVRAATLTGSEPAGRAVAATCGDNIKTTVLELGGSDAFIVMPSCDLDDAVEKAVTGRILNNGQSCIAAKRFIIHDDIHDEFRDRMVERFESLKVGDPKGGETDVGPLALAQIRDELDKQVRDSVKAGARLLTGGKKTGDKGYYYQPGILTDIPADAPAYSDELFGPVASLYNVDGLESAIKLANDTRFGLGSSIFTTDETEIELACRDLDAGATFVNSNVASDPRLPFGGVKASGYGRELSSDGLLEFVNRKTVSIA
jgi:succinate-semialdehyde dehydrogenase/glutarate-semialdehyde dehydrogenase